MSLTITRPPRAPQIPTTFGSRRLYTLHSTPNNVFAWRLADERLKTATVAFRRHEDAETVAHAIERHLINKKEWPDTLIVDNTFRIFSGPPGNYVNQIVYVQSWQPENLKAFCGHAYLDLVMLETVERDHDKFNLRGELCRIEMPDEYYVHRLEEIYDSNADEE
jgi:hypothetical protein